MQFAQRDELLLLASDFSKENRRCIYGRPRQGSFSICRPHKVHGMELSKPDDNTISIDGDDHILVFFDQASQRLVIEGISCRYQIRRADVVSIESFQFISYLGAHICYRIDADTVLGIAIVKPSFKHELLRQAPYLFFLRGRIKNWVLEETQKTIGQSLS